MTTTQTDPKTMATELLLRSPEEVSAKCAELGITPAKSKMKMIDQIIVNIFGLDACKRAFSNRR
jgi:hypothetical protein